MKRTLIALLALGFGSVSLAQTVRIMGYAGIDETIVSGLIDEVIGDDLEAEGITIQYEPLQDYNVALFNALSAGTAGDLLYLPDATAPGIIATGTILPLNDVFDTEPFIDNLLDVYTVDDQIYGIPKDFNTLGVFYNKDLFDEAGVEYPNENDTWETFAEKLRGVKALGDDVYGACFPADFARFGAFAYAAGWPPFDGESTDLTSEAFVQATEWYTGLIEEGVVALPTALGQDWGGGCFATGNVGVAIEGAWLLTFLNANAPNLQYGSTFIPTGPSGERGNFLYTVAWGVNANSPEQEAALRVLEALTSEEAQQWVLEQGLAIPSREALADNPYFEQDAPAAQASSVIFQGATMGNVYGFQFGAVGTDFATPISTALTAIATGQAEVMPALEQAQGEVNALIERAQ